MQNDATTHLKEKLRLSDKNLVKATKAARFAELWCMSGVVWWGGAVALGLGAIGLHAAFGVTVPAVLGTGAVIFGGAMAVKSVALQWGFHKLHDKALEEQEKRGLKPARAPEPAAATVSPISKILPACHSFNVKAKARILDLVASLPHPTQKRAKLRSEGPQIRL